MKLRFLPKLIRLFAAMMVATAITWFPIRGAGILSQASAAPVSLHCLATGALCTEVYDSEAVFGEGNYVGHDEPATLFYSNTPGSGYSNLYRLTLPSDPRQPATQAGTGGTFNLQLHPTFWFGMALCDTQSAPEFTNQCTPDSDTNIFDNADPAAADYMGRHPGTAVMEMQFYPPGLNQRPFGVTCDPTKWCAALTIDSLSQNLNTGQLNNADCLNKVTQEPVNLAMITRSGVAQAPSDPLNTDPRQITQGPDTLIMNSGDQLSVDIHDTSAGVQIIIHDLTSGQTGSMTASIANGFAQVNFRPKDSHCSETPYAFHPMYSTSSEHTRVVWAAHSLNIAFSDEIGHFEYCNAANAATGACTSPGVTDPAGLDLDDIGCFPPNSSSVFTVGGCQFTDIDFDGPEYANNWPGTDSNAGQDQKFHASPVVFSSPLANGTTNFQRVAFETDLPRIEDINGQTFPRCQRATTGANCVNPPPGATFYPFFTTGGGKGSCVWQEGGAFLQGTTNSFGGNSTAAYGPLLKLFYPGPKFQPIFRYNNFRNILSSNPCPA